ncbi:ABC-2 type transport system ATP-binding protein [Clostridium cavendishii DSM 21758]|uniref:ABC-2 type transport system ATP-binding protein n=1 Tax=Clostridium cavendishii DSM 21758 TaxID=1121302 RepID=A0A1M6I442_9CLOT|nr:ABC transporter ATP-binding protein [Clostridium cavendishii]SHJ29192.1 ABC-2 type transport system ATP-binding protein [Clostridium cavendishii DSM 21758]
MDSVLEVKELIKSYRGKRVLNGVSFNLEKGKVLGILAPNGVGKSTLLDIIANLCKKDSGSVKINGLEVSSKTKDFVSYLQEKNVLYNWMTVKDAMNFYKDFFKDFSEEKFRELMEFMSLDERMKVRKLSKGMKERLELALTLSRETKLYILDEPISGVDIVARERIADTIIKNINEESSMIITTHYIGELDRIFDEVMFICDGEICEFGLADDLREKYGMSLQDIYKKIFGGIRR